MVTDTQGDRDIHLGSVLTAYCFGEASDSDREAVEQHLFVCDRCWEECHRLMGAVDILRAGDALPPPFTAVELLSVSGISSRLGRPFAGHRTFALGVVAIFALQFLVGVWVEVGYSYDRFGHIAWLLSWPAGILASIAVLAGLNLDVKAVRGGRDDGLLRSVLVGAVGIALLTLVVVGLLPAEQTIRASFQTRTAAAGYLKDVLVVFAPVLVFILPSFHTVVTLQRLLGAGRFEKVLATLVPGPMSVPAQGVLYLSPRLLGVVFLALGGLRLSGANHMLDALSPGPYAQLFSVMTYLNVGLWFGATVWSMAWFASSLNELKREAVALGRLTPPRGDQLPH